MASRVDYSEWHNGRSMVSAILWISVAAGFGILAAWNPEIALLTGGALAAISLLVLKSYALFVLVLLTIPLRTVSLVSWGLSSSSANLRIGDSILLVTLALWFISKVAPSGRFKIVPIRSRLDIVIYLFLAINVFSIAWAPAKDLALLKIVKFTRDVLLYVYLSDRLHSNFPKYMKLMTTSLMLTGWYLFAVLLDIVLKGGILGTITSLSSGPLTSFVLRDVRDIGYLTFAGTINALALWANTCLFIAVGMIPWFRGRIMRIDQRLFLFISSGMLLLLLLFSFSRSVWIGFLVGILVLIIGSWREILKITRKHPLAVSVGIATVLLFIYASGASSLIYGRLLSIASLGDDPAIAGRLGYWKAAAHILADGAVLLGVGSGNVAAVAQRYNLIDPFLHDVYLQVLTELGIFGLMVFLWLLFNWVRILWRATRAATRIDNLPRMLPLSILAGTVSYLIAGLTLSDFAEMEVWILLAVTSGLTQYLREQNTASDSCLNLSATIS